jgi:hypothetical protein
MTQLTPKALAIGLGLALLLWFAAGAVVIFWL